MLRARGFLIALTVGFLLSGLIPAFSQIPHDANFHVHRAPRSYFYLCGSSGTVMRYDPFRDSWKDMSVPGETHSLWAIHGSGHDNIWTAAQFTWPTNVWYVYQWDGSSWTQHVLDNTVLPQEALDYTPIPGGIWTFGPNDTYVAVCAASIYGAWWLIHWDGSSWTFLDQCDGGAAYSGAWGVSPNEIYFAGVPAIGVHAPLWLWNGSVCQLETDSSALDVQALGGIAASGADLIVSGIDNATWQQGIWRGSWGGPYTLEYLASGAGQPHINNGNNWCFVDSEVEWVIGIDAFNRATIYEHQGGGSWSTVPGIADANPCNLDMQVARIPGGEALLALYQCGLGGGNDTHVVDRGGATWELKDAPDNHVWFGVWGIRE